MAIDYIPSNADSRVFPKLKINGRRGSIGLESSAPMVAAPLNMEDQRLVFQ
jgi:hypothetical protein